MNYIIKELLRHKWRTAAGISGYIIATLFILLILSVTRSNENDSVRILKGTGTHFIVYIPSNAACCVSCENESSDGSLVAEGVHTLMLNSDLLASIKEINGVRMLHHICCTIFSMKSWRVKSPLAELTQAVWQPEIMYALQPTSLPGNIFLTKLMRLLPKNHLPKHITCLWEILLLHTEAG